MPALQVSLGLGKESFQSGQWLGSGGNRGGTKVISELYSIPVSLSRVDSYRRAAQKLLRKTGTAHR